MIINYPPSSAYANTPQYDWRMGIFAPIDIPPHPSDIDYTIDPKYIENPMLLSQDVYNTPAGWYIFSWRNIDVMRDPIWDLQAGVKIKIPTKARLAQLGIRL